MTIGMTSFELNNHERIIKAKVDLNRTLPFFSYILLNMNIEQTKSTENIPTMGVNQFGDLYWNDEFVGTLKQEELHFVLAHEAMHVSTLTFQREGMRDHGMWNIATDLVINYMLIQEGLRPPKNILVPDHRGVYKFQSGKTGKDVPIDLNDKCAEQVYEDLMKHVKFIKSVVNMDGEGNYDGQVGKHIGGDKDSNGKDQGKNKSVSDAKANEQKWKQNAIEASTQAKMRGNMSANMERMLGALLEPVVDWRVKLFAYITNYLPVDYTMRMPSRRFNATGVYTPTVLKENLEVIVGVDISGSISSEEYVTFMSEALGIADSYTQVDMRVIGWACHVDERDDIMVNNDTKARLMEQKFYGGGGTSLSCFTEYCEKKGYKSRVYVILTDGYIESNPKLPADGDCLFVVSKNGSSEIVGKLGDCTSLNDVKV